MENQFRVEMVFQDYKGRRAALIRALTTEFEKFREKCDPGKECLCLYGLSNESWDVNAPVEQVPPGLPEPVLGINLIRDRLEEKDWISFIATHSDVWLFSIAFFIASRLGFNKSNRNKLFELINNLPTVTEVVRNAANEQQNGNKEASNSDQTKKQVSRPKEKFSKSHLKYKEEVEKKEVKEYFCWMCGQKYKRDKYFWICCDNCGKWFHGKCVKITIAEAERIKFYNCPSCRSNKKPRKE